VSSACSLLRADFLLGLLSDGGGMFLSNVDWLLTDYTALYPRRYGSSLGFLLRVFLQGNGSFPFSGFYFDRNILCFAVALRFIADFALL
jgi:hypothetical protein